MKILVCISNVPDTTTKIKLAADSKSVDLANIQWVINPWDELALTRAIELKESNPAGFEKIVVMIVGDKSTEPTIRKALSMGADEGIRVDTDPKDAYETAFQLQAGLAGETYELILCGIESSDYNNSAVGGMLAEFLDLPSVSSVSKVEYDGGKFVFNREIDGGFEILAAPAPVVAVVQKGIAKEPRIPSMRGIMSARTKPIKVIAPSATDQLASYEGFELPKPKSGCKFVDPENMDELVRLLHEEAKTI